MQEIDRRAVGDRIREIRTASGLRQWELARRLGTTQSAVHKYEHGIVPEPSRLLELSRIGNTTVEWILTGAHAVDGATTRERVDPTLLQTASLLRALEGPERERLEAALRILRQAAAAAGSSANEVTSLVETADRIRREVLSEIVREARERMDLPRR